MKLHLVRHPQPDVAAGLCYGATDVPAAVAELARVQAMLEAQGLPGRLPVYASPLQRCALLARRLQPASLHIDARLAEMDFGRWEMRPWSDIPRGEVDAWADDLLHHRPGGAENVLDVARRVAGFVDTLKAGASADGGAEALVICHAGTIRLLLAMQSGLPLEQAALQAAATPHRIGYGEILMLEF
ncbi:histidine phosphatase family protein [Herbaspirillum sp. SJZ107]|uniref:histidine phosphatase family protein n=1 Tax=Herbaspirillum sp. SJZ107 TaxID=2572881 RepID=UPI00115341ED|nr:histidine phosphatase family protein [Herbaspirillum sp. SJZ107]TQK00117.1 alpha-ribazole phosphatase [Herbaspirillum sp. SJZ107]